MPDQQIPVAHVADDVRAGALARAAAVFQLSEFDDLHGLPAE